MALKEMLHNKFCNSNASNKDFINFYTRCFTFQPLDGARTQFKTEQYDMNLSQ